MYKLTQTQLFTVADRAAEALFRYCEKFGIHYVVTGSSGGLDSAVTLGLAQIACKKAKDAGFQLTSVGLILPCESNPDAERLGREAIQKFGAEELKIDLTSVFQQIDSMHLLGNNLQIKQLLKRTGGEAAIAEWDWSDKIAKGNIKARLRMMLGTYHVARMIKGIVLSTDNLSEFWMAFWTICGDVGDYGMIQQLLKGLELSELAIYLGVPEEIVAAKPDDGLAIAGGDEDQLGAAYPVIDQIMIKLVQSGFDPDGEMDQLDSLPQISGFDQDLVHGLARRALIGSYKRKGTVILSRTYLGLPEVDELNL